MSLIELITQLQLMGVRILCNSSDGWVFPQPHEHVPWQLLEAISNHRLPLRHLLNAEGIWDPFAK
jgi:hypothetical protein